MKKANSPWGLKLLVGSLIAIIAIALTAVVVIRTWQRTPMGRLNPVVAVINRLFSERLHEIPGSDNLETFRENHGVSNASEAMLSTMASIRDMTIPGDSFGIPIRVYTPRRSEHDLLPVIVHYHGGGFVLGSIEETEWQAVALADYGRSVVVSVEYRLAPEHPFPAAIEDAYTALEWVYQNAERIGADRRQLAVAGDSAGGNIAVVMTLMARDLKGPEIDYQILLYPSLDNANALEYSYENPYDGYGATVAAARAFRELYLSSPEDKTDPYFAPLLSDSTNLPPAAIVVGEFDILKYEARMYAEKLIGAGIPVLYEEYPGLSHGFFAFGDLLVTGESRDAIRMIADDFQRVLREAAHPD